MRASQGAVRRSAAKGTKKMMANDDGAGISERPMTKVPGRTKALYFFLGFIVGLVVAFTLVYFAFDVMQDTVGQM
jgi:hypothetical protein